MAKRKTLFILLPFFLTATAFAQTGATDTCAALERIIEREGDESETPALLELFEALFAQPMNLNTAKASELESLSFLTPAEIRRLVSARRSIGTFARWEQVRA
ncbi:MAG: helix-hairpin-helix domain-containing protein, partial [Bacteroidota bacterium]|nr:helix-hairpin-helix domain-containing protein [Bacteroidota bacterium]